LTFKLQKVEKVDKW